MTAAPLAKWRKSMCSMLLRLYKSASLTLTSSSRSLEESTWDNSHTPGWPSLGQVAVNLRLIETKVTPRNDPFLHGNAVSVVMRHVKDFVMTKKCLAWQLAVRKRPESRVAAFSFPLWIFMRLLVGLQRRGTERN